MFGKSKAKDSAPKAAADTKAKAPAQAKDSKSKEDATSTTVSSAPTSTSSGDLPSMREVQEQKKRERDAKIAEAKEKLREAIHQKKRHELERRKKLETKRKRDLAIFVAGLFVMLTILIYFFPSPFMIVFSTLLLFTFFFLGIAYQRMIMQILVVAVACVIITALFYVAVGSI